MSAATAGRLRPPSTGGDRHRTWSLAWTLAATEWKLRFYGSALGYVWSLARPFLLFGVIYIVFVEFAKLGEGVKHYAVYILFALVLFQFFLEITTGGVSALVEREGLLRKVRFPRMVIPLSVLLTALLNLGGTLVAALIFALLSGAYPTWGWLQLPLLIGIVGVFGMGIGMLLGALFVRYRDIKPIWDVVSQTLFYASPILYVTTTVPDAYEHAYSANPLAATFAQMRHAMLDPAAPTAWEATGGAVRLLVPIGIVVIAMALGWWVFKREAPRIAEHL